MRRGVRVEDACLNRIGTLCPNEEKPLDKAGQIRHNPASLLKYMKGMEYFSGKKRAGRNLNEVILFKSAFMKYTI